MYIRFREVEIKLGIITFESYLSAKKSGKDRVGDIIKRREWEEAIGWSWSIYLSKSRKIRDWEIIYT